MTEKLWQEGPPLKQTFNGPCGVFAWMALALCEPWAPNSMPSAEEAAEIVNDIYYKIRIHENNQGIYREGTTPGTAAKGLVDAGFIPGFRRIRNLDALKDQILNHGPAVITIFDYHSMYKPSPNGRVTVGGHVEDQHAVAITGYTDEREIDGYSGAMFRLRNSWGETYGINGSAWISDVDMAVLYSKGMQVWIAEER